MPDLHLGIDVGSTTVKLVLLDHAHQLLADHYLRARGQPRQVVLDGVARLAEDFDLARVSAVGFSGSGGEAVARIVGGHYVNELVAQVRAVQEYHLEARSVIEIGGQDSKFLSLERDESSGRVLLRDFAMNALCAAGTGSFLDQQAERLGIAIDGEFAEIALRSELPARIAGRCTVFAKSDMIHLQQRGTPLPDILAGLCLALARNFHSVIGKGKQFTPPILFQGGVAFNAAVVRAFRTLLGLDDTQLIVPRHHWLMAAIGVALVTLDDEARGAAMPPPRFEALRESVRTGVAGDGRSLPPLARRAGAARGDVRPPNGATGRIPVYVGVDVGSISTNVVLIDESHRVIARRYLMTAGKPLEAVRQALREIGDEAGERVTVLGGGTTGSGRHLTGDFVGADVVRNEIAAKARAALDIDPSVDTIFEIGGQDSKFIRLQNGAVVDFAMNNACAAGTGSFLEEQAERLRIALADEFSRLAFSSPCPAFLGERCTVFMESDLIHHQQRGARLPDLTAGLAYSIAQNYLNRVVSGRAVGRNVFFQGGVAWNDSVVAAFEQMLHRPITVPPHHDVTGAIGVAILAQEAMGKRDDRRTAFRGFDLADRQYEATVFECRACPNLCEVSRVVMGNDPPIFYGARCDRFEEAGRTADAAWRRIPDLFAERTALLMGDYVEPAQRVPGRLRVGLPRALLFYELFPYWRAMFDALGMDLVLSDPTNPDIIRLSQEHAVAETCFPVKLMYGHVLNVLERDIDVLFLPSVMTWMEASPEQEFAHVCPLIPAATWMTTANLDLAQRGVRAVPFTLQFNSSRARRNQFRDLARRLHVSRRALADAAAAGERALAAFQARLRQRGAEVLDTLATEHRTVVVVGRPYNTTDAGASQDLPYKLRRLGVLPVPMDYLPTDEERIADTYPDMYWRSGQNILGAAKRIARDPRLHAIYLTNFNCGPDSFLIGFFRRLLDPKPFLELEIDDHTADAGIITRCEAFLDSLAMTARQS